LRKRIVMSISGRQPCRKVQRPQPLSFGPNRRD
jgi:hypothetical protein